MMLLIHPPVTKPGEPPAGVARLAAALRAHGASCRIVDANLEGLLWVLNGASTARSPKPAHDADPWTRRALRHCSANVAALRSPLLYRNPPRYQRAVADLERLLNRAGDARGVRLGLAHYRHPRLSPARSADLLHAAQEPEENLFYPYFQKKLRQEMEELQPRAAGVSLNFLGQALTAFAILGFLKREFPHLKLVLGGGLVTSWTKIPGWKNPFAGLVDLVVSGPGEGAVVKILEGTRKKGAHEPPAYDLFPLGEYLAPGPVLPYSASSGCYWNRCLFCPERAEGNPYLPIPAGRVAADLRALGEKIKPVLVHFLDNALAPAVMEKIIEDPCGVPWYGFARFTPHLADPQFCLALRRSGCVMLQLGLESGDQGVLDHLQKGLDLAQASRALVNLKEAGIATYVYLLFGTPAESHREALRTLEFAAARSGEIDFLNLAIFNLPVNGEEARELPKSVFYEGDLSLYTGFAHPRGWDRKRVRQFLDKEFKRHAAIAPILRNDPPVFTSNHAPFFIE